MTNKDLIAFAESKTTHATIIALKDEGMTDEGYLLCLCAYLKELPAIIVQEDSWNEFKLINEIDNSYQVFRQYEEKKGICLPEKLNYHIEYIDKEEWMNPKEK